MFYVVLLKSAFSLTFLRVWILFQKQSICFEVVFCCCCFLRTRKTAVRTISRLLCLFAVDHKGATGGQLSVPPQLKPLLTLLPPPRYPPRPLSPGKKPRPTIKAQRQTIKGQCPSVSCSLGTKGTGSGLSCTAVLFIGFRALYSWREVWGKLNTGRQLLPGARHLPCISLDSR